MDHDTRHITLISRHPQLPERKWDRSETAASRVVLVDSFAVLRCAAAGSLADFDAGIERIILDRCSSASEYLGLLAETPPEWIGDALMIRDDDTGFLSSSGHGGDRILYALSAEDVRFYLETHRLVERGGAAIATSGELPVPQFLGRTAVA